MFQIWKLSKPQWLIAVRFVIQNDMLQFTALITILRPPKEQQGFIWAFCLAKCVVLLLVIKSCTPGSWRACLTIQLGPVRGKMLDAVVLDFHYVYIICNNLCCLREFSALPRFGVFNSVSVHFMEQYNFGILKQLLFRLSSYYQF